MANYYAAGIYNPRENPPLDGIDVLQWTTEPPTVEGWYWALQEYSNEILMVNVCAVTDDYLTTTDGPLHLFTHWLGPLPTPEPPKGE